MTAARTLWLIDEGHHGHRAQSEGLAQALEAAVGPLEIIRIPCAERIRGALRPAARLLLDHAPARLTLTLTRRLSTFDAPSSPAPTLILSSGGRTAFASRALARATGAPNVFVGDNRPFPARWFSAVMAPTPHPWAENVLDTGFVPSTMTPARCAEAAARRWDGAPPREVCALLVGGASRSHLWRAEDFARLGRAATMLAQAHGIRWLVTTSRRTGAEGDRALATALAPEAVAERVLFSEAPEPVVAAYLGAARAVYVTQDSATMLSEAAAAGRPTMAVAPPETRLPETGSFAQLLTRLDGAPWIRRLDLDAMARTPPPAAAERPHDDVASAMAAAAGALVARLGLTR